jgi:hypothetical protein
MMSQRQWNDVAGRLSVGVIEQPPAGQGTREKTSFPEPVGLNN